MTDRWFRASKPDGQNIEGPSLAGNDEGVNLLLGEHSSAFISFNDGWVVEEIPGPLDPESPLGIVVAAYWRDWDMTPSFGRMYSYQQGCVGMVMSFAVVAGIPGLESHAATIKFLNDNRPKGD